MAKFFDRFRKPSDTNKAYDGYNPSRDLLDRIRKDREDARERIKRKMKSSNISNVTAATYTSAIVTNNQSNITWADTSGSTPIMKVDASLEVNGRDVMQEIDEMREALLLLKRDVAMEEKYPKLKEIKDQYDRQLEIYKTWDSVKGSNK